jgi:serine/threonine-protein kinase RsbW
MASLDPALAHVKSFATGSLSAIALRAETALEELLTNSVVHGNAAQSEQALIWLSVAAHNESLKLRFEDAFAEFDPLAEIDLALQRAAGPLEQRRIGGLGLLMVYRLADEFLYMRANGRNCIELSFLARRLN